jgi:ATP-dependent DNA ligase
LGLPPRNLARSGGSGDWPRSRELAVYVSEADLREGFDKRANFDLVYQAEISRIARRVRPELVAEITYLTRTDDGLLRHVLFQGLREDKPAGEVRRDWRPAR